MKRAMSQGVAAAMTVLVLAGAARAVDMDKVNQAVENGTRHLKSLQLSDGTWAHTEIGLTALCGLTLLECGAPTDDEGIQKAAAAVRTAAVRTDQTYSIALCIMFLDRLGESVDVALIESMTVRLLAGQLHSGGWTYACPKPPPSEERRLTGLVRQRAERGPEKGKAPPEPGKRTERDLTKEIQGQLDHIRRGQGPGLGDFPGDNSNTQFAVLGLWTARKYGLPVDKALERTDGMFRRTTNADGGWPYIAGLGITFQPPPGMPPPPGSGSSPAMTCSGLLGIGLNYGLMNEAALRTREGERADKPGGPERNPRDPSKDKIVVNAFRLLGNWVDAMARGDGKAPRISNASGKFYYFAWSLERVCVAYGLEKVGKTDWYDWAADILLANQGGDGGWNNGEFRGGPDTCFALLVLRRADLVKGLNRALTSQMKGGLESTLRQGGVSGADLVKGSGGRKPFFDNTPPDDAKEKANTGADAEAAKLGTQLASAQGEKRDRILKELSQSKGAAYTDALASAIPKLEGEAKEKAREALADRLSRMTSATLEVKLSDDDTEIRRAAALAVAMKEDRAHANRLIELLNDAETTVARAAHAALKSLSGEDFGPTKDATREERGKAIRAWQEWLRKQGAEKK
jgi:hypothetical protein